MVRVGEERLGKRGSKPRGIAAVRRSPRVESRGCGPALLLEGPPGVLLEEAADLLLVLFVLEAAGGVDQDPPRLDVPAGRAEQLSLKLDQGALALWAMAPLGPGALREDAGVTARRVDEDGVEPGRGAQPARLIHRSQLGDWEAEALEPGADPLEPVRGQIAGDEALGPGLQYRRGLPPGRSAEVEDPETFDLAQHLRRAEGVLSLHGELPVVEERRGEGR